MEFSGREELVLLALLAAVTALTALAPTLRVPYPILLVLGGLALGFVPGVPTITLPPEVVLVGVLPPLLYSAAFFTGLRDLRANVRPIGLLAVGLVVTTMLAVATIAHYATGLSWPAAFVLGAIVAPTDPIAATAIAGRLGVPRRIVTIVEGESLVNDATALVLYATAVTALVTGSFSLWHAGLDFAVSVVGGLAVGLGVGWVVALIRIRLDNIPSETLISLLCGYLAYIPAQALGVSGVLAAVTIGVYLGWRSPELSTPAMRMQAFAVWETLVFLVNALLFTLIGMQLGPILDALGDRSTASLIVDALVVTATVMVVRIVWVLATGPRPAVVGWMGMRGAVSLAAALALPLQTDAGAPFPGRELIIFLAFAVILGTLVVQGLTLPAVIRRFHLEEDELEAKEDTKARIYAAEAAIQRLEELLDEDWVRPETAERLRGLYNFRRSRFQARFDGEDDGAIERQSTDYQRLRRELLEAERAAIVALRREGRISDDVMRRVERDLDLEDSRLEI
ncbi:MAG TPA: Na+/H+ antiporter [Gaiellaceae bacterium]|jgi:CPA1 family monovalent cation:H+ antiporter|nr:Na+/H+ antiporter [Gaiellaceae bacterium]